MNIVYLVQVNSDDIEGRGTMETVAAFLTRGDAKKAAEGRGPSGTDARVVAIELYDSYVEYSTRYRPQSSNPK